MSIGCVCVPSRAQEVTAKGVGVTGGIAAGAEVVLVVESIIRIKPIWPYWVFPIAGAIGGGIGGYKLEKHSKGGAIALLVTSMVGVIPTAIAVSSSHDFKPEDVGARKGTDALQTEFHPGITPGSPSSESKSGTVSVEVEAPSGVIVDAPEGPPVPAGNMAPDGESREAADDDVMYEDDSKEAVPEEMRDEEANPHKTVPQKTIPKGESTPAPESKPESQSGTMSVQQTERLAHLSSGALFHMNRQFRFGFGIPAIDVYPVQLPQPLDHLSGVEVHIPVIAMDLP